jgi:isopenicillin N synthase-like dioxygenase
MPAERLREGATVPYVPVVDISADPGAVGAELDEICRTTGFFQVTGHGVPGEIPERAWTTATRFFDLPPEDKLSVARPAPDYPYGYIPLAGESLSQSIAGAPPPDLKEVFNAGPPARPARPRTRCAPSTTRPGIAPRCPGSCGRAPTATMAR